MPAPASCPASVVWTRARNSANWPPVRISSSERRAVCAAICVGPPGGLSDHRRRNRLDISELKAVVLDEADEMLDMGFREDMEFILETTPETRRTLLFSATLPRVIVALAKEYQHDAFRIEVGGDEGGHAD